MYVITLKLSILSVFLHVYLVSICIFSLKITFPYVYLNLQIFTDLCFSANIKRQVSTKHYANSGRRRYVEG